MAETVLVAYPYPQIRPLFEKALGRAGFDVTFVERGDDAWARLEGGDVPAAVVAAVMLEGLDGFALAEAMRRQARLALTPILLLGYCPNTVPTEEWEAEWRTRLEAKLGPCEMMNAPFSPDDLVGRVQALRARREAHVRGGRGEEGGGP